MPSAKKSNFFVSTSNNLCLWPARCAIHPRKTTSRKLGDGKSNFFANQ
ncbi:hypothetical protein SGH10_005283 (plasmid) [Klebsiella pneumoniae]|uniref:Uncharacterized protein n=1 Tax=Klebsiella pneumoniae TaxID=573 RepID=A0A2U8T1R8_KLEPN|nr:hypothetical protein SGH10_005283 [Klebsiella pneumoniae]AWM64133.1 Hypothetical protein [Klebsiella pneumoniae]QIQ13531.1 hypothetical protein [Klebsiella pneumoniae]QMV82316.1 hypothetical protein [Klebsiella pneumoniae]QVQ57790.1 hypothetical protein [Klebsiella pneumoniae]